MKYLKIKNKYKILAKMAHDQYMNIDVYGFANYGEYIRFFIPEAIITIKEFEKMIKKHKKFGISITNFAYMQKAFGFSDNVYKTRTLLTAEELMNELFEVVEIPKNKIYWFFGFRFESKEAQKYEI